MILNADVLFIMYTFSYKMSIQTILHTKIEDNLIVKRT